MSYDIQVTSAAAKQIRKLPARDRKRVLEQIQRLAEVPRPNGVKKLSGFDNAWRIRIGQYRVIYEIKNSVLCVTIIRVAARNDAYRS